MAEIKRAKNGRILFTKEMKKDYTILVPNMLPIHFGIMKPIFENEGYNMVLLNTAKEEVKQLGLRYVHNDTCYPALLVTGQFLEALNSGKYDVNKTALIIMQSGGGCRASNYIHIIRKALEKSGFPQVPVMQSMEIFRKSAIIYLLLHLQVLIFPVIFRKFSAVRLTFRPFNNELKY